jgi:hypothetical protein
MKNLLCNLMFFTIYIVPSDSLFAQENITVIDSLLAAVITEDIQDPQNNLADTVNVINSSTDDGFFNYSLVVISNQLQQAGFRVYRHNSVASIRSGMIIEFSRISAEIIYTEPYTKNFLGSDFTQRLIRLQLNGQIRRSETGELVRMIRADRLYQDEIKYNEIEELEGTTFSFTQGERKKYSGWDRFIEPALVISSVIVVVLLFFTQRA